MAITRVQNKQKRRSKPPITRLQIQKRRSISNPSNIFTILSPNMMQEIMKHLPLTRNRLIASNVSSSFKTAFLSTLDGPALRELYEEAIQTVPLVRQFYTFADQFKQTIIQTCKKCFFHITMSNGMRKGATRPPTDTHLTRDGLKKRILQIYNDLIKHHKIQNKVNLQQIIVELGPTHYTSRLGSLRIKFVFEIRHRVYMHFEWLFHKTIQSPFSIILSTIKISRNKRNQNKYFAIDEGSERMGKTELVLHMFTNNRPPTDTHLTRDALVLLFLHFVLKLAFPTHMLTGISKVYPPGLHSDKWTSVVSPILEKHQIQVMSS